MKSQTAEQGTSPSEAIIREIAPTPTAADYAKLSLATLIAYRADWADFTAWCQGKGVSPLPAEPNTVANADLLVPSRSFVSR